MYQDDLDLRAASVRTNSNCSRTTALKKEITKYIIMHIITYPHTCLIIGSGWSVVETLVLNRASCCLSILA